MANWTDERRDRLKRLVSELYRVVGELDEEFATDGKKFTPDGHLMGSLGEVVAAYAFDLDLLPASTKTHDAVWKGNESSPSRGVQIKLTGGNKSVSLYSHSVPDALIVIQLFEGQFRVVYNGEGALVCQECLVAGKSGQQAVRLQKLRLLHERAVERIPQIQDFPLL